MGDCAVLLIYGILTGHQNPQSLLIFMSESFRLKSTFLLFTLSMLSELPQKTRKQTSYQSPWVGALESHTW